MNGFSYSLYLLTRQARFLAGSVLKLMNGQVTPRLLYEIAHNKRLQRALNEKKARLELLDSWILYKLRSGNGLDPDVEHITDITSSTATGLYDPFTLSWSPLVRWMFGIDVSGEHLFLILFNSSHSYSPAFCPALLRIAIGISDTCILRHLGRNGTTPRFQLLRL